MRNERSHNSFPRYPGKTLAVLSCALALLASHPLTARAARGEVSMTVRTLGEGQSRSVITPPAELSTPRYTLTSRSQPLAASDSREARLSPAHDPMFAALSHFALTLLTRVAPLLSPNMTVMLQPVFPSAAPAVFTRGPSRLLPENLPPPCERQYALARLLLAPPL